MSISSSIRKAGPYVGNDLAVDFPFAFKVFSDADLLVVLAVSGSEVILDLGTDYTVALNADQDTNPGGTITTTVVYSDEHTITLTSSLENLQPVVLTNLGGFYPKVINAALDRLTILVQQVAEKAGRALTLPISANGSGSLPAPTPNGFIGWDALGQNLVNYAGVTSAAVSSFMGTLLTAANAAAARAGLGLGSDATGSNLSALTNAAMARSNLGLVIGTNVLAPNGNGSGLTNLPSDLPAQTGNAGKVLKTSGSSASWDGAGVLGTSVASTSGTAIDFTSIPSWAKRVTLLMSGLSSNGSSIHLVRVGSGSIQSSGYSASGQGSNGAAFSGSVNTTGIPLGGDNAASYVLSGHLVFEHLGSNVWSVAGNGGGNDAGGVRLWNCGGTVTLSGALDRVRLTTVNGTDTFDAGQINILYE